MKTTKLVVFFIFLMGFFNPALAQDESSNVKDDESYKDDISFMIQSLQTMFNLLGDPDVTRADKDVIINQSYLKYFRDDKIQIEDDLDPNRQLPMNKDVKSYLQDVVFFYKDVHFVFELKEITKGLTDNNEVYFKASINRILEGNSLYGEPTKLAGDRYIEFDYTQGSEDFKIVSIYTTKLSEKEDIETWWNTMDKGWRNYFAEQIYVNDSLTFDSLLTQSVAIYSNDTIITDALELMAGDTFLLNEIDTLFLSDNAFYNSILNLFKSESLTILPEDSINNLNPLEKLTELIEVSFKDCQIDDVSPLRTLLSLRNLDASGSLVSNIQDLQYLSGIENLDLSNTQVKELGVAEAFENLQFLDISNTRISDISFLESIPQLQRLNSSGTDFESYSSISKVDNLQSLDLSETSFSLFNVLTPLTELQTLKVNDTRIVDLSGLNDLENIEVLSINKTIVASLQLLEEIETIKMVYCDDTKIDEEEVKRFITQRPDVLVIYETESLLNWWENINPELKEIILEKLDSIPDPPDTETLHKIIFTEKVDLTGYSNISSLESLEQLINVHEVYLSGTKVSDLTSLSSLTGITKLDVSNTEITSLEPLISLRLLQDLNIENTTVNDLSPLSLLLNLEVVWADSSGINKEEVLKFEKDNPALVVYQTNYLMSWWDGLNKNWKKFLSGNMDFEGQPKGEDLQRLLNLDSLNIPESSGITDIEPLKEFTRLKYLKMDKVEVTDLSPLSNLITITDLTVSGGPVNDFSSITSLYNLVALDLSGTALNDLNFIIELPGLERLSVQATAIYDLKPLTLLKNLEYLDISYTKVKKLKPLNDLEHLKELKCTNTAITEKNIEKFKKSKPGLDVTYY